MDEQEIGKQLAKDIILTRLIIAMAMSTSSPVQWVEGIQEDVRTTIEDAPLKDGDIEKVRAAAQDEHAMLFSWVINTLEKLELDRPVITATALPKEPS